MRQFNLKKLLCFLFLFFSLISFAQITIRGKVLDKNKRALEGASVYFNNTLIGTTTDENGAFEISIKEGQYDLIISFLGFKTINYPVNKSLPNKSITFILLEDENVLDEIVIKKIKYDDEWKYNLQTFKQELLGQSDFAKNCKISNPKVLRFEFDQKTMVLTAQAHKPLQIINKDLGYLISFDLVQFSLDKNYSTYLGYTRFKALSGSKRKQKKWSKNRQKAYNGSKIHFYKSLMKNTTYKEGFIVNQFRRVPNKKRPSEEEIKKARELIKLSANSIDFTKKINIPITSIDSARVIVSKAILPKFEDYLYNTKLPVNEIIEMKDSVFYLSFKDNLSVVYTKEKEGFNYLKRNTFGKLKEPGPQTSSIIPRQRKMILDKLGILSNPLSVFYEGYWSFEKMAETLPLDYEPN